MANGKDMMIFNLRDLPAGAADLPDLLKERGLYDGTKFMNVPEASAPEQAAAFSTTGICQQGKLAPEFSKALSRAKMVQDGVACGAYGWNDSSCIAEWRVNPVYDPANGDAAVGELLCLVWASGTGLFLGDLGGRNVDVSRVGYAPFLFALWGFFCEKCEGFQEAFTEYCADADDPNTLVEAQMAACRLAAIVQEALQTEKIAANMPTNANMRRLTAPQMASQRFAPNQQVGVFVNFKLGETGSSRKNWKML